jgi:hypothetical protein
MVDPDDVFALAADLPEVENGCGPQRLGISVAGKGLAWSFNERVDPKKPRVPRRDILAVRCAMAAKEMLLEAGPDRFFDDAHYRGYPAVLVRLAKIEADELRELLRGAWWVTAPKAVLKRAGAI